MTKATNGVAATRHSAKPETPSRRYLLLIAILALVIALVASFFLTFEPISPNTNQKSDHSKLSKKAKQATNNNNNIDKSNNRPTNENDASQTSSQMVEFIDQVLDGTLDDFVTIEQSVILLRDLLKFNNLQFAPRISSIVKMDPFKFAKFNLKRPCTLWPDIFSCTKRGCNIKFCDRSELPESYLELDNNCPTNSPKALSKLDQTISEGNVEDLNVLFECSRDDTEDSQYYDLIRNPERFTGYDGLQIWKAIYEENCFPNQSTNIFSSLDNRCYEERVFYRSISGLHTSITTHLTSIHHKFNDHFGPNPNDYYKRFYGNSAYLKNLFFVYLIELRALYKSQSYLLDKIKWKMVGDKAEAQDAIKDLLKTEKLFKWHFNENVLFTHEPKPLAQQLAAHFHNITFNIMDCVSCDKCRLWGKVQTNGLGTAFKILLTKDLNKLRLSHHEITCLLNALARLSHSISEIEHFRNIFHERIHHPPTAHPKPHSEDANFLKFM